MDRGLESGDFRAYLESTTQSFLECPPSQFGQMQGTQDRAHDEATCQ